MLSSKPNLPLYFRFVNVAARFLGWGKSPTASLDEKILSEEAMKKTGLNDFGDLYYKNGLSRLIESAKNDADLHYIGRVIVHASIVTFLCNRLLMVEARKKNPELSKIKLLPPIIILGLPRTGTTHLQRMLSIDPKHRGVPLWEIMRPVWLEDNDDRQQIAAKEVEFRKKQIPGVDRMHFSREDTMEECIYLLGTTFFSNLYWAVAPVYGYYEYLKENISLQSYEEYRFLLQVLQSAHPTQRLVLKAPHHTMAIDLLAQAVPEALVIQTHRHPVSALNSFNSLVCELHNMTTKRHDRKRIAQANIQWYEEALNKSMKWREEHPGFVFDVHYNKLLENPLEVTRDIYSYFQLEWRQDNEELFEDFLRKNQKGKYGEHKYHASDFGVSDTEIMEHFESYFEKFEIEN